MHKKLFPLLLFPFLICGAAEKPDQKAPTQPPERWASTDATVEVVSVSPDSGKVNQETEFLVKVRYNLGKLRSAEINFGVSDRDPKKYTIKQKVIVEDKSGTVGVFVRAKPLDMDDGQSAVILSVNLSEFPHEAKWSPVAGDKVVVKAN